MDIEDIRIEKLKQKILRFNGLMEELSQEFTAIFYEGNKEKFHDDVLEMVKSKSSKSKITIRFICEIITFILIIDELFS